MPEEASSSQQAAGDPQVEALLKKMNEAGQDLQTLSSTVRTTETDYDTMADIQRIGKMWLDNREGDTRFRVTFRGRLLPDNTLDPDPIHYVLIGDELVERNEQSKTQITRKLPPEQAGKDLLKLGEGPFPLPIGQSPEEVHRQFVVSPVLPDEIDEDEGDVSIAEGTERLRLEPRPETNLANEFTWVLVDLDPASGLPKQVITLDAAQTNLQVVELINLTLNEALEEDAFTLPAVNLDDWTVTVE